MSDLLRQSQQLAQYLGRKGILTPQVFERLKAEMQSTGNHDLGALLVRDGVVTQAQLDFVLPAIASAAALANPATTPSAPPPPVTTPPASAAPPPGPPPAMAPPPLLRPPSLIPPSRAPTPPPPIVQKAPPAPAAAPQPNFPAPPPAQAALPAAAPPQTALPGPPEPQHALPEHLGSPAPVTGPNGEYLGEPLPPPPPLPPIPAPGSIPALLTAPPPLPSLATPAAYAPPPPPVAAPVAPSPATHTAGESLSHPHPHDSVRARTIDAILEDAERRNASDVHLHPKTPLTFRLEGRLTLLGDPPWDPADHAAFVKSILDAQQLARFEEDGDLDFAYVTPTGLRVRANMYVTHAGVDATFRLLKRRPPSLEELGLPQTLEKLVHHHQGLVLVTGPAGCGKSTTLAALIDLINKDRSEHVLVLEDPIEVLHPGQKALVNQRQVGRDTESFARALRGALREDPDVIVIGELRDRESISLAVSAAETGHLVLGSMHTNSAGRTIARLIDAFPPTQQGQVRAMLSESLRGVVSQRLVLGTDGKRVPAVELLLVTPALGNLIREGKLIQVKSAMQTGKSIGMRTMDETLKELVAAGRITAEEARKHAENPANIHGSSAPPPLAPPPSAPPAPAPGGAPGKVATAPPPLLKGPPPGKSAPPAGKAPAPVPPPAKGPHIKTGGQ